MFRHRTAVFSLVVLFVLVLSPVIPAAAQVEVPANDLYANATQVTAFPFSDTQDISAATLEDADYLGYCYQASELYSTVWYKYTATEGGILTISTDETLFDHVVVIMDQNDYLMQQCWSNSSGRSVEKEIYPGVIFYIMVGATINTPITDPHNLVFRLTLAPLPPPPPPANDNFANAQEIQLFNFPVYLSIPGDTTTSSVEAGELTPSCMTNNLREIANTVWYKIQTNDPVSSAHPLFMRVSAYLWAENGFTGIYRPTAGGEPEEVGCTFAGEMMDLTITGNDQVYYIQIGSYSINGEDAPTASLSVNIQVLPLNDSINYPVEITSTSATTISKVSNATTESGEPNPSCGSMSQTVWYTLTPIETTWLALNNRDPWSWWGTGNVAVYRGRPGNLTEVACVVGSYTDVFHAEAGVTYYIQVGSPYWGEEILWNLWVAPPLMAGFVYFPETPTVFDPVNFYSTANDPAGAANITCQWSFGDGTVDSSNNSQPVHQYAKDGDYSVTMTATADDGRTAKVIRVVQVRTHDIAITRFSLPDNGRVGQSRPIYVYVTNTHYDEMVTIQIYRSSQAYPDGWDPNPFGTLTLLVKAGPRTQTTRFYFNYVFRPEDLKAGKVNFKAVATIQDRVDSLPADNLAISLPVKVR